MEWDGMIPGGCDLANPFGDTVAQPYNTAHRLLIGISRLLPFRVSLSQWEWIPKWVISVLFDSCAQHVFGSGFYLEMVVPGTRFKGGFNVV